MIKEKKINYIYLFYPLNINIRKRFVHKPPSVPPITPIIPKNGFPCATTNTPPLVTPPTQQQPSVLPTTEKNEHPSLPKMPKESPSIAERTQHCIPKKGVQKGWDWFSSTKEDDLFKRAQARGILEFEETKEFGEGTGGVRLTTKGITLYKEHFHHPEIVKKEDVTFVVTEKMPLVGNFVASEENILLHPTQKHMVVVFSEKDNAYLAIGTLTSKKGACMIYKEQIDNKDKSQYFQTFDKPKIVSKENFEILEKVKVFVDKSEIKTKLSIIATEKVGTSNHYEVYNGTMVTYEVLEGMIAIDINKNGNSDETNNDDNEIKGQI